MNSQKAYSMRLFTFVQMKEIIEANKYFIWIDECSWHLDLKPKYGYSLKGKKCNKIASPLSPNISLLAAISKNSIIAYQFRIGAYNELAFANFLIKLVEFLLKEEEVVRNNFVLWMDNCGIHKTQLVRALLRLLHVNYFFGPPYQPQLSAIEYFFGILKSRVKQENYQTQ